MKNILYLHAGAEMYGADIVLLELLKNLDKTKFKPIVVLPCNGPLVDNLKANNIETMVVEYPILRRKYFNPKGIINYGIDYVKYSRKLINIAKEKNIDIVHTNTAAVLEGVAIKRKLNIKHIWHIHEIIVKPKALHKFLSFVIAKTSDKVITVSNAVKEHLNSTGYFKDINIIYNGVDNSKFSIENETDYIKEEFNIPKDALVVGMIGRVNAWKGQKDFLQAIDEVLKKNENCYAMLVGGVFEGQNWRINELKAQIANMENNERIIFSDYRNDSKNIHALYDVFVLPSTNPDPLPTVVLESMASSTPVVAYRHGGVCEMVKDETNGFLVDVCNPSKLAEKINELVENDELRKSFSEQSLNRQKEYFSLNSYINNFEKLYDEL